MIGGLLGNSGSLPISANGGPATSGASGDSGGSFKMGNINMGGGGMSPAMLMVLVLITVVWLWKKK